MNHSKIYLGVIGWVCLLVLGISPATAQTFNLHNIEPDVVPAGSTLEWHSAVPVAPANLVTNVSAVDAGIYYAVYKSGSCYSAPSPFKIVKTNCGNSFTDLYASVDTADKPASTVLTFHTAKPVALSNLYSGNAHVAPTGTYYAAYYDPAKDCYTSATPIKVIPNIVCGANPDFNVTHVNVPVNGNTNMNDNVPAGTTYGTPAGNPGNPTAALPVMNPDGSYSFTATDTGVYVFYVPVCSPDTTLGCVLEPLTITVTDPYNSTNPPVVNPDLAIVDSGSTVTIPVLDNDEPGNPGGHLGLPMPSDPPNGTVTVTPGGEIIYTPDPGFTGVDTFTYTVCDTSANPDLCRSTTVTVDVHSYLAPNTILAGDDFDKIRMNTAATGNVTFNDMDPDGDLIKVTAQNMTLAGVGTFMLDTVGNYVFTPLHNFFGTVELPYTVCDTGGHCASATLHILVDPVNILQPDFNVTHVNVPVTGGIHQNDNVVPGTIYGNPVAVAGNPSNVTPLMQTDGTYTFTPDVPGIYVFEVPVCAPAQAAPCPTETLTITVANPYQPGSNPPVVNPDIAIVDSGSTVTIPVLDNDQPGNTGGHFGPPTTTDPPHGTVTTTPGGEIVYTPDPGFTGTDTFTYTVCDTTVMPFACGTTTVTVTVTPPKTINTIWANDDYVRVDMNTMATGNVMSNDIDPDGDPIAVTPQSITLSSGTFSVDASGNYTFTPNTGFYGPVQVPYTVCDTMGNCTNATLHILVDPRNIMAPDFNVTNINVMVGGNMSTNDALVPGSTFNMPTAVTGNPTADLPSLNSDGSYSFITDTAGVYKFEVPVCAPAQAAPCPVELLTITVLNPTAGTFPPVVNPDNATVTPGNTVTIPILTNDDPTSPGGSFGTPGITTPPSNGIVTVHTDGTVDYTPAPGFTGVDSFSYTVCDTVPTPDQCGAATVTIQVLPPNAINMVAANDDYANTYGTVPATGNVMLNDNDPEGNSMAVTPQQITTAQGTLSLQANGNYSFTAVSGFTGTVNFIYNVCDNAEPQACDKATLHILVDKAPDYTPLIYGSSTLFSNNDTVRNFIVAIYNVNNTINKGQVKFRMSQSFPNKVFIIDPAMAAISYNGNSIAVGNSNWIMTQNGSFYEFTLKTNVVIPPNGAMYIGFQVKVPASAPYNQIQPITANIIYQSGGDSNYSNNNYSITTTKN